MSSAPADYEPSVGYFMGMPTWVAAGDPSYQIWMSHISPGTVIANLIGQTPEINEQIGYSGDVFSTYSHCGTHIDNLNNLGSGGQIWNHFTASEHFGSRHWTKMRRRQMAAWAVSNQSGLTLPSPCPGSVFC